MTLGAVLVHTSHCQAAGRFHDVAAVRVMALDTIHFLFQHRVMLRKMKFHFRGAVTLKTRSRILPRVQNELPRAAAGDMKTGSAMARFAAGLSYPGIRFEMDSSMGTRRKRAGDLSMALGAGFVADES